MITAAAFEQILVENEGRLPLLTLDEFFADNDVEDSIAPNQWGYGRPVLADIAERLQKIALRPEVAWVRVMLHDDTEIRKADGQEVLELLGDSIVLCTTAEPAEMEKWVDCEWLCADGVIAAEASELAVFSRLPLIPEGFGCLEIVWD